jgi:hypothetical protein
LKNTVSITALSAVGGAFSIGAGVGAGAVCAPAPELKLNTAAIAAIAVSDLVSREWGFNDRVACRIALSFFRTLDDVCRRGSDADRDHAFGTAQFSWERAGTGTVPRKVEEPRSVLRWTDRLQIGGRRASPASVKIAGLSPRGM